MSFSKLLSFPFFCRLFMCISFFLFVKENAILAFSVFYAYFGCVIVIFNLDKIYVVFQIVVILLLLSFPIFFSFIHVHTKFQYWKKSFFCHSCLFRVYCYLKCWCHFLVQVIAVFWLCSFFSLLSLCMFRLLTHVHAVFSIWKGELPFLFLMLC